MATTDRSVVTYRGLVSQILDNFGVDGDADALACWVADVASWNDRIDLTAARDDDELADLMLADAALLASCVGQGDLVDVGSGAGAPGLPLAILRPGLEVSLVEPMQKRTALLRMTIGKLGLAPRVSVHQKRGDALTETFATAISRATLAPAEWLALGARLAPTVWVLLAKGDAPSRDGWTVVDDRSYRWPLTGAERRAVCYVKLAKAP